MALILAAALALVVEGALGVILPALVLPDVALLATVAAALFLAAVPALGVLAGSGFAADLLAGSPLGLHVVVLLVPFLATQLAHRSLELRRGVPEAALVAVLTPAAGVLTAAALVFSGAPARVGLSFWVALAAQTAVNALLAPVACALAERISLATGDADPTRRGVSWAGAPTFVRSRR